MEHRVDIILQHFRPFYDQLLPARASELGGSADGFCKRLWLGTNAGGAAVLSTSRMGMFHLSFCTIPSYLQVYGWQRHNLPTTTLEMGGSWFQQRTSTVFYRRCMKHCMISSTNIDRGGKVDH